MMIGARNHPTSILKIVSIYVNAPPARAETNITVSNPCIFFHQRKTSGSSVRQALVSASQRLNVSAYIACHGGIPCTTYNVGTSLAGLYAGHFSYVGYLADRLRVGGEPSDQAVNGRCATIFRDPVDRLESCYYFYLVRRKIKEGRNEFACMSNVPVETMRALLKDERNDNGYGCLNEPFRIFSHLNNETLLSSLNHEDPSFLAVLNTTLQNLSKCLPLILNDPKIANLTQQWFPQLSDYFTERIVLNVGTVEKCELSEKHREMMIDLTKSESIVYDAAVKRSHHLSRYAAELWRYELKYLAVGVARNRDRRGLLARLR